MNANTVFMILGLLSIGANLCDWIAARGTGFMHVPGPGWPRVVFAVGMALLALSALLHLSGVITAIYAVAALTLFVSFVQVYSIFVRRLRINRV